MNTVIIPEWVERALERAGAPLSDALKAEKLLSILSKDDVAFYVFVNTHPEQWLPASVVDTFNEGPRRGNERLRSDGSAGVVNETATQPPLNSYFSFLKELGVEPGELCEHLCDLVDEHRLRMRAGHIATHARSGYGLFDGMGEPVEPHRIYFEVKPLEYEVIGLVPRVDESSTGDKLIGMMDELLSHLNMRLEFHKLAQTPLFRDFVARMETQP